MENHILTTNLKTRIMNAITETRRKLLADGYKFIRTGEGDANNGGQHRIKICGGDDSWGTWRVHSKWPSKAARDREMVRLVHEEKCLCLE